MDLKNLKTRIITGALYVIISLALVLINQYTLLAFCIISYVWLTIELKRFIQRTNIRISLIFPLMIGLFALLIAFLNIYYNISFTLFLLMIIPIYGIFIHELFILRENSLQSIAHTLFFLIYPLLPILLTIYLSSGSFYGQSVNYSPGILVFTMVQIWIFDSMAYIFGVSLGKHRLYEKVSPKKSWEGFIGGFVITLIIGILVGYYSSLIIVIDSIFISIIVSVFGTFGDLVESLFKRNINLKDSGNTLPGHGGLLDRLDSFIFVIPWIFLYFLVKSFII
ncbi:MAG: phosphatidate cytidylyltransferase [Bacteroidales bacterium]|nr:phosphatidate cytidylyltransferase [Bacteroidales bacterium]HOL97234.1 phosphatidate cytidylyltransferase [Bacteroidales bacterium]HOM35526.1 phosphatidate cytidylyltransferase [Bacteroidales bacterium]HPD23853.1 phosphatidate cytidylyltransferase [Bacteroidales bacterium]HRS98777.1 phosphatidate cytidylyltransferase [Bacteroidales bacterium]